MGGVGLAAAYTSLKFPKGSQMMPMIYSFSLIILATILGIKSCMKKSSGIGDASDNKESMPKVFLVILLIFAYIFSIQYLGFYSATALFLLVFMGILKAAKLTTAISIALLMPLSIYIFFGILMKIPVPSGMFF